VAFLVLIALGVLAAVVLHRVVSAAVRALALLLRAALVAGLAGVTGLAVGSVVHLYSSYDETTVGIMAGAISLPVWLLALGFLGRRHRPKVLPDTVWLDTVPRQGEDAPLAAAWASVLSLLPSCRKRLSQARETSQTLLRQSEADPLNLALLESAVLIRKHIPALVAKASAVWPSLTAHERKQHANDVIEAIEQLSEAGERVRAEQQQSLRDDLRSLLIHVRARTQASK
jgi:hypothetical protein